LPAKDLGRPLAFPANLRLREVWLSLTVETRRSGLRTGTQMAR
jgi:hypothetical protein